MKQSASTHDLTGKTHNKIRALDFALATCLIGVVLFTNFSISLTQISGFVGIALWLVKTQLTKSWRQIDWTLGWPFALFIVASLIVGLNYFDLKIFIKEMKRLFLIAIFFWVLNTISTLNFKEYFLWASDALKLKKLRARWTPDSVPTSPFHFIQFCLGILIVAGVLSACVGLFKGFFLKESIWWRNSGALSDVMSYSLILMVIAVMAVSALLFDKRRKSWLIFALIIILLGLLLTLSRQTWVGLFIASFFLVFFKKRILALILPLAAIILLSLAPQTISDRFYSVIDFDQYESVVDAKQRAISQRLLLWKAGFQIFKDHPIVGCGFRCADRVYDQYPEHKIIVKYRHFHSNIIQIAVDMGLLGLFSWMAIWVVYLAKLYRKTRQDWDSEHKWIHLGIAGAFIAFFVSGMFENNFYDSEFMMLMYFLMALPFALPSSQTRSG